MIPSNSTTALKRLPAPHLNMGFNLLYWRHHVGVQGTSNLQYSPLTTGLPGLTGTGEASQVFISGYPTQTNYGFGVPKTTHGNIYVGFIGDTWKATRQLTLTLGLQYVYATPPRGNQVSAMDVDLARTQPSASDFTFAYIWGETNPITNAPANASPGLLEPDRNNFAPRFAMAYSPFKNTSIRTGFGLFYDYNTNLIQNNNARGFAYPFAVSRASHGSKSEFRRPFEPADHFGSALCAVCSQRGPVRQSLDRFRRDPYAMNWNFGIEQLFPPNMLLAVDYVGSGGDGNSRPTSNVYPSPGGARGRYQFTQTVAKCGNQSVHHQADRQLQLPLFADKLERRFSGRTDISETRFTWSRTLDYDSDPNSARSQLYATTSGIAMVGTSISLSLT